MLYHVVNYFCGAHYFDLIATKSIWTFYKSIDFFVLSSLLSLVEAYFVNENVWKSNIAYTLNP